MTDHAHRYGPTPPGRIDIRLIGDPDDVNTTADRLAQHADIVDDSGPKHLRSPSQDGMVRRYIRAQLRQDADA